MAQRSPLLSLPLALALALLVASGACVSTDHADKPGADGSSGGADRDDGDTPTGAVETVRHTACAQAASQPLPEQTAAELADLEARVNAWTAIPCELARAQPTCGAGEACEAQSPICFRADEKRSSGVCGVDARSTGVVSATTMSYREGRCVVTARPEDLAAACCRNLPGFDCRTYPFAVASQPGQRCVQADDCEAGLVCAAPGVCMCPGVEPALDEGACLPYHEPLPWLGKPLPDAARGTCTAALSGYFAEVLDEGSNQEVHAALAPDGVLHAVYVHTDASGASTRHASRASGAWSVESLALPTDPARGGVPYEPAGVVIDGDGALHVALAGKGVQYATNRAGNWELTHLEGVAEVYTAGIALGADGTPRVAYASSAGGVELASVGAASVVTTQVSAALPDPATRVRLVMTSADVAHVFVAAPPGYARHFAATDSRFVERVVSPFERLDAIPLGENLLVVGSQRLPTGRVEFVSLDGQPFDFDPVLWEQPASRYERAAPRVQIALGAGGVMVTYTTPLGRFVYGGTLEGSEAAQITSDVSQAELVADAENGAHIFIADGHSLFHLANGACPASPR